MSNKTDGGPAFPSHGSMGEVTQEGMSLRAYFAAKAMQGWLASYGPDACHPDDNDVAKLSVTMADALLLELGYTTEGK